MGNAGKTKGKIQETAKALIIEKGYTAVTMTDIAEVLKLSIGGLYYHYHSVEEILFSIVNEEMHDPWESAQPCASFDVFIEWLQQYFAKEKDLLLSFDHTVNAMLYQYFFSLPTLERKEKMKIVYSRTCDIIRRLTAPLFQDEGKVSFICNHLFILLQGLNMLAMSGQVTPEIIDAEIAAFIQMLIALWR